MRAVEEMEEADTTKPPNRHHARSTPASACASSALPKTVTAVPPDIEPDDGSSRVAVVGADGLHGGNTLRQLPLGRRL